MPVKLETISDHPAAEDLKDELTKKRNKIWTKGLDSESFSALVDLFVAIDDEVLNDSLRSQILDCLVPCEMIPDEIAGKMILWVICNCINSGESCAKVIQWVKCLGKYDMISSDVIKVWYNELLKRLLFPKMMKALSDLLFLFATPEFMTKSNVTLLQLFYDDYEDFNIKKILWKFAQHVPHLVEKQFYFLNRSIEDDKTGSTCFERAVMNMASRAGIEPSAKTTGHVLSRGLPAIEYQPLRKDLRLMKIGEVKSLYELGRALERLQLPTNELALLQSEEGIMTIIVNGPSPRFLTSLSAALSCEPTPEIIAAVSGLQDLLSYGLPPVTDYLSDFLCTWDGIFREEYVYSLLPRFYFSDSKDLLNILKSLSSVFFTGNAQTKVKILDSLLHLITNMVANDMQRGSAELCQAIPAPEWLKVAECTVLTVIDFIIQLYTHGLALEGPDCSQLVLNSILFHKKLNCLIVDFDLPFFIVINQSFSYAALSSKNHTILNELCSLIIEYKKNIIPIFEQKGLLGEFEMQVESVMAIADSTYKYLWESVGGERPENFHTTIDEFTPSQSIGMQHMALYSFLSNIARELGRNLNRISKTELMSLLENFMPGIAEFVKNEEMDQKTFTS